MSVKISNVSRSFHFPTDSVCRGFKQKSETVIFESFSTIAWALVKIDLHEPETERSEPNLKKVWLFQIHRTYCAINQK